MALNSDKITDKPRSESLLRSYALFSGLAFQMLATIGLACWLGIKADQLFGLTIPVFTIIFCLGGIVASFYVIIKNLKKD